MRLIAKSVVASAMALFVVLGAPVASAVEKPSETNTEKKEQQTIVVQPGDSLSKIADAHNTTYQRIFFANTTVQDPDVIYPGDKLRIPAADEELAERPLPADAPVTVSPAPAPAQPVAQQAAPAPQPYVAPQQKAAPVASGSVWDQLALCESGGNWAINTGNGFYGGLQFTMSSWQAVGGTGSPANASREEQIARAQQLQAIQGWGAWPACSAKLGLL